VGSVARPCFLNMVPGAKDGNRAMAVLCALEIDAFRSKASLSFGILLVKNPILGSMFEIKSSFLKLRTKASASVRLLACTRVWRLFV